MLHLTAATIFAQELAYVNAPAGLTLRAEANQKSKKIVLIPDGSQVEVLGETKPEEVIADRKGKWQKIKWQNKMGWAFDAFLSAHAGKCIGDLGQLSNQAGTLEDFSVSSNLSFPRSGVSIKTRPDNSLQFEFVYPEDRGHVRENTTYKLLNGKNLQFIVTSGQGDGAAKTACIHDECQMASDWKACEQQCAERSTGSRESIYLKYTLVPARKSGILTVEKTVNQEGKKVATPYPYNQIRNMKTFCLREFKE